MIKERQLENGEGINHGVERVSQGGVEVFIVFFRRMAD
jgi:hypothetical protein